MPRVALDLDLDNAAALRGALGNIEIGAHYQPIIDFATGWVVGVEALARWRRQSGEMVAPDGFIGLAEEIGLIDALGRHVLRIACRDALVWSQSGPDPFMLSVNVSPRQFPSGDLMIMVLAALQTGSKSPVSTSRSPSPPTPMSSLSRRPSASFGNMESSSRSTTSETDTPHSPA